VVRVLRKIGVDVGFPPGQTCCGQPLYNSGYTSQARQLARRVLEEFSGSAYVVVPSGSCAAMMSKFYLDLFQDEPESLRRAQELSSKIYEFSQFLTDVMGVEDVGARYEGAVTYHPSCHLLREMEVRTSPARLLNNVGGVRVEELPQAEVCCGFGGTFSVKYPHISEGMVADKTASVLSTGADTLVSCDMSCLMNIEGALSRQGSSVQVRHLAQVLDGISG
jgi:L-lactate dehydrogenase complex protein LldE